jgi:benzoyl-CoA reductase/2-hydroxyglutaryl-CoA dehydratase subunit BcrC/BadD/HgdB
MSVDERFGFSVKTPSTVRTLRQAVSCTSPWIPAEWLKAHGFVPRGLWSTAASVRSAWQAQGVCAFAQSCLDAVEARPDSLFIFDSSCDQMRRSHDTREAHRERTFLFNLPATWRTPVARQMFRAELERLSRWLVSRGGQMAEREAVLDIIAQYRAGRGQLLRAVESCSARQFVEAVAQFHADGSVRLPPNPAQPPGARIPLALLGAHLPAGHWELLDAIEHQGGRIALNATDSGERTLLDSEETASPAGADDPAEILTRRFIASSREVFQRPNTRFYHWVEEQIRLRRIRGIVLWTQVNCDLWRAEAQSMKEVFCRPLCLLEEDNVTGCSPRNLSRIQAFLEQLR